jgi:hypothetical protein
MVLMMGLVAGHWEAQVALWKHLIPGAETFSWLSLAAASVVEAGLGIVAYAAAIVVLGVIGKADLARLLRRSPALDGS